MEEEVEVESIYLYRWINITNMDMAVDINDYLFIYLLISYY